MKRTLLKRLDDIVDIIKDPIDTMNYRDKLNMAFTKNELNYCSKRLRCLGARFVIKECVFNYLETEMGYVEKKYREIEILNDELRKPILRLFGGIRECARKLEIKDILISISHSRNWIAGMVIFCYE